jgi:murein peptide amidase A
MPDFSMLNKNFIFGHTTQNVPIPAYHFGTRGHRILIIGGVHGDEVEGVQATHGLLGHFLNSFYYNLQITLVPCLNIDGLHSLQRKNARGVDLNRNLPTIDWNPNYTKESYYPGLVANSEPENQALVKFILENRPQFILSMHSWNPMLNTNGDCKRFAQIVSSLTGYIITDDIGYPTPGSLGTYAGIERNIPTLTYEVERHLPAAQVISRHVPAILEGLKHYE